MEMLAGLFLLGVVLFVLFVAFKMVDELLKSVLGAAFRTDDKPEEVPLPTPASFPEDKRYRTVMRAEERARRARASRGTAGEDWD